MEDTWCNTPAPESIELYSTDFTGEPRARCSECGKVWALWECACEFEHECEEAK